MTHLLEINNLDVKFDTDEGRITAIDNVSLTLDQGKVLGIVGESGSGKSVTAKSIMQLNPGNTIYNDNAEIIIDDENVLILPRDSGFNNKEKMNSAIQELKSEGIKVVIGPITFNEFDVCIHQ